MRTTGTPGDPAEEGTYSPSVLGRPEWSRQRYGAGRSASTGPVDEPRDNLWMNPQNVWVLLWTTCGNLRTAFWRTHHHLHSHCPQAVDEKKLAIGWSSGRVAVCPPVINRSAPTAVPARIRVTH